MARLTADHRRRQIVETARQMSYSGGLYQWTLQNIADALDITQPAVRYYFFSTANLRELTILNAIRSDDVPIVVQALVAHDPLTDNISADLRNACGQYVVDDG